VVGLKNVRVAATEEEILNVLTELGGKQPCKVSDPTA
jgi:hypothetical protein